MNFQTMLRIVRVKSKEDLTDEEVQLIVNSQFKYISKALKKGEPIVRVRFLGSFRLNKNKKANGREFQVEGNTESEPENK